MIATYSLNYLSDVVGAVDCSAVISSLSCDLWLCNQHVLYLEKIFIQLAVVFLHAVPTCLAVSTA